MDASGWILLLVVAVCVVALIYVAKKSDKLLEETPSDETDSISSSSVSGRSVGGASSGSSAVKPAAVQAKVEEPEDSQVTIYAYGSSRANRLCTLCDGENDVSATHCRICGNQLI